MTKLTSLGKCGLRGTGGSMWRGGRSKDGPWNQPLRDRRHLSCVKTSDTWTKNNTLSIYNRCAITAASLVKQWWKTGRTGYSYLVKGDWRNFKEDERVQRGYERLHYTLRLEITWWQRWKLYTYTLLLSESTEIHTKWGTHCLLCKDRGFPRRCSAMEARDTGWKQCASPPIHHHDTKEHLIRKREYYMQKKRNIHINSSEIWSNSLKVKQPFLHDFKNKLTCVFIFCTRNIHCGLQFNPQHFPEPGAETPKQCCPENSDTGKYIYSIHLHFMVQSCFVLTMWLNL